MIGARILVMTCVRIAAVVIALLLSVELSLVELSAQPVPQENVTIRVTDTTGAVIPGARIEFAPSSSGMQHFVIANGWGEATIQLPTGSHLLRISSIGFMPLLSRVDVQENSNEVETVALRIDGRGTGYPGPTGWLEFPDLSEFQPKSVRSDILIPLHPLLNLDPLPLRSAKRRW